MIGLYLIAVLVALAAYFVTGRLRPRDRAATIFLAILLALTLTAMLARILGERMPIRIL